MQTNYYWFNPETSTFYGANSVSHEKLILNDKHMIEALDKIRSNSKCRIFLDQWHDILIDLNWVRLYFNHTKNELGISCNKNKSALKTVRNFVKKEPVIVESLFLDVKDIGMQIGLFGKDIDLYINHGRINPVQNS